MYDRIGDLVYIFAMNGSSVVVVLDGPTRHHSKKAWAARVMDAEQARFDSLLLRKVLLQKIESIRDNTDLTPAEVESTKDEIICIEKEIKSREKKFQDNAALPINIVESIRHEVDNVRSELGNSVITVSVVEAVTQADCVICYHAMWNGVDEALANDGDFIAGAGKKMMLIKDFKIKRGWKRTNKSHVDALGSKIVAVGYRDVFHSDIVGKLNLVENDIRLSVGFKYAHHPLFEHDHGDAKIRATIIVGLGCDTLPKGCPKLGPPMLLTVIQQLQTKGELTAESLYSHYATMNGGLTATHYRIFSESILNEPANISTDNNEPHFIHTKPAVLSGYNKEFIMGATDIVIDDSIKRCWCCGPKRNKLSSHAIAQGEPTTMCIDCKDVVCTICTPKRKYITKYYADVGLQDGAY